MAGSFDVFRKYQRGMLAAVAILAMLAFFVLPPILQMAPESGVSDPLVATWRGGGISRSALERAVAMRSVLNDFQDQVSRRSGRPWDVRFPVDEADVVRTLILAREAEANGIVVGDAAVNRFLAQQTNNMVRPEEMEAIVAGLPQRQMVVTAGDIFEALRTFLAANRMVQLSFAGFAGDPPGSRWDVFRRLEQQATVEVVPVLVESFAADVPAPAESALRGFFDSHKDALPVDRSPVPGFKEPHRISYEWVVAERQALEAAAEKDVTEEQIAAFYEENKARLYPAKPPAATEPKPADAAKPDADKPDAAAEAPATEKPAAEAPAEPKAAVGRGTRVVPARFRQSDAPTGNPAAAGETPADDPAAATPQDSKAPDASAPDVKPPEAKAPEAKASDSTVEPLDKVRDDVRKRLAAKAVTARIDALFRAMAGDVGGFAQDLRRWERAKAGADSRPVPPSAEKIAETQGLKAGRAEKRTAGEAARDGGVGATFQLTFDPGAPMGFRQAAWTDLFFDPERLLPAWRAVESRDVAGDRFLSWKTADYPEAVPEFEAVRADVERAWRIGEARPLAEAFAEKIRAAAAGGRSLAEAVAEQKRPGLEVVPVEPFTWLSRGDAAFGSPMTLSQPAALALPGEAFMKAVFALEPGGTAVAFNEPRTVCYVVRLVSYSPTEDELRQRFADPTSDQRRIDAVLQQGESRAFRAWLEDVEKRAGLEWKQPPRGS